MPTLAIVPLVVVALVLGFLVGRTVSVHQRGRNLLARVFRPVLAVGAGVGLIAGLVYAAGETGWSNQLWGQLISVVALATATYALYGTGRRTPTVTRSFTVGSGDQKKTYAVNTSLADSEYKEAKADHADKITHQRGLYFRALYTGADGRWSTSKMQILLWTYAVLFALLAIFVAMQLDADFELVLSDGKVGKTFGDLEFYEQYLILLGGYFAASVLAKGIKTTQANEGNVSPPVEEKPNAVEGIKNLVSDDAGKGDVGDTQFFLFNILALTVFFVSFIPHLEKGLPELPTFLTGLTSLSALAYVGKKAVESSKPKIVAIVPSKVRPKRSVRIEGSYLASSLKSSPSVMVDGVDVDPSKVEVVTTSGTLGEESVLSVEIPEGTMAGTGRQVSVRPRGAEVPATADIEIVRAAIEDGGVNPEPVPWRSGVAITVTGTGFGPDPGGRVPEPL